MPVEPIGAVVDAFRTHPLVALGEAHGNEQGHAFRLALIRDKRFTDVVHDIVVEFGNARFQDVMDKFVRGDDVDDENLRHVWQDTTQISGVWDRPIYEEFFRAVRAVNRSLPAGRKLRVLLGDPPFDWELVRKSSEVPSSQRPGHVRIHGMWIDKAQASTLDRDRHAAEVVRREVLARRRRGLLIFGDMHVRRIGHSLVSLLESTPEVKVFTITNAVGAGYDSLNALRADPASWKAPSLALVPQTVPATGPFSHVDAVLYLGPPSAMTVSRLPASLCSDAGYVKMRRARMAWYGLAEADAQQLLARDCPGVPQR